MFQTSPGHWFHVHSVTHEEKKCHVSVFQSRRHRSNTIPENTELINKKRLALSDSRLLITKQYPSLQHTPGKEIHVLPFPQDEPWERTFIIYCMWRVVEEKVDLSQRCFLLATDSSCSPSIRGAGVALEGCGDVLQSVRSSPPTTIVSSSLPVAMNVREGGPVLEVSLRTPYLSGLLYFAVFLRCFGVFRCCFLINCHGVVSGMISYSLS